MVEGPLQMVHWKAVLSHTLVIQGLHLLVTPPHKPVYWKLMVPFGGTEPVQHAQV